jgi:hypothetical protein
MSEFSPLSGYALTPTKPIRGSTEATSHSDMAGTPLELGLRAGGKWFHDPHQDDRYVLSSRHAGRGYEWKLTLNS